MKKYIFAALMLSISNLSYGGSANFDNLISCEKQNGLSFNCQFNSGGSDVIELVGVQPWPTHYTIDYNFACNYDGAALDSPLALTTDNINFVSLTLKHSGRLEFSDSNSLKLVNKNAKRLRNFYFTGDCQLHLAISYNPTSDIIAQWQAQKNNLEGNLATYRDASNAYQKLALLLPAFELLNQVLSNLSADIGKNSEIQAQFMLIKDMLDVVIMTDVTNLNIDQKKLVLKVTTNLSSVWSANCSGDTCASMVLGQYLTKEDEEKIAAIVALYQEISSAQAKYEEYTQKVIDTSRQIDELRASKGAWL